MGITFADSNSYWNYFLALEADLEVLARYIQPTGGNLGTFSIETARLLMAAASENDVVLKLLCKSLDPDRDVKNIHDYRDVIIGHYQVLPTTRVEIPRFGMRFYPWENWGQHDGVPDWWSDNNKVKHERNQYFARATYKNAFNALGGLFLVLLRYYQRLNPEIQLEPIPRLYRAPVEEMKCRHTLDGRTVIAFRE